jgi:hypothetical protein
VSARRPLLTATAAGSVLFALWFVPSANATVETGTAQDSATVMQSRTEPGSGAGAAQDGAEVTDRSEDLSLADTGSVDTTPYLVGGTAFLGLGAAMVSIAARRARMTGF